MKRRRVNKILARFKDYLSFEFPHLGFAIVALLVAAIWKGSSAAAIGAVVLVIVHSKESLITSMIDVFKKPEPNAVDDQKIKVLVESLNKLHANHKALDEKIGAVAEHVGKMNLRLAIKPLEDAGVL